MLIALKDHWPEYAIEAWCLGTFMVSACAFGVLLFNPASPAMALAPGIRMVLMGLAMGLSAVAIICSPWGKRSGAHFNPAVTLTFLRLRKIKAADAAFYVAAQFVGGVVGVALAWSIFGRLLSNGAVNYVVTSPGSYGVGVAFAAEAIISFIMMTVVLLTSNSRRLSHLTPIFAGTLVALFITFESPISGMSMNPARTFASAAVAGNWASIWVYFAAPPIAMLAAAEIFVRTRGLKAVLCARLSPHGRARCIFNCGYMDEKIS